MSNCIVCNDKDKVIKELLTDRDKYRELYADEHNLLVQKDYQVQNQKDALLQVRKTMELYENENKHLRGLLRLWV